jgi:proline dehydrogenase
MGLTRELLLRASKSEWLARQLTRRGFTRRAVRRFMPGEDLDSALGAAGQLRESGIPSILTLLGENVTDTGEADTVARHFIEVLDRSAERGYDADISIKPTHLGLDLELEGTYRRVKDLVQHAARYGRDVAIDMEDSSYVDRTLELYRRLRAEHANVAICLQAYLHRAPKDIDDLLPLKPTIRLVKGAYTESRDIACRGKRDMNSAFLRLAGTLLERQRDGGGLRIIFGTHDPRMIEGVARRSEELGLPRDAYEIQMLYGIQRQLQLELAAQGYRMRVLISYGDSWFPWYMRRLAERPANVLFLARNLLG